MRKIKGFFHVLLLLTPCLQLHAQDLDSNKVPLAVRTTYRKITNTTKVIWHKWTYPKEIILSDKYDHRDTDLIYCGCHFNNHYDDCYYFDSTGSRYRLSSFLIINVPEMAKEKFSKLYPHAKDTTWRIGSYEDVFPNDVYEAEFEQSKNEFNIEFDSAANYLGTVVVYHGSKGIPTSVEKYLKTHYKKFDVIEPKLFTGPNSRPVHFSIHITQNNKNESPSFYFLYLNFSVDASGNYVFPPQVRKVVPMVEPTF